MYPTRTHTRTHAAQRRDTIPLTIKTNYSSVELPRSAFDGLVLSRAHRARDRVRVSRRSVFVRPWAGGGGEGKGEPTAPLIASPQQCVVVLCGNVNECFGSALLEK